MTIIASAAAAPVWPRAAVDGLYDIVAEAWSLFAEVQDLKRLGVTASIKVEDGITVHLTVSREAVGLLLGLAAELESAQIIYTPDHVLIAGTTCQHRVPTTITIARADLTVGDLEDLVAVVDFDPEIVAYGPADDAYMGGAAARFEGGAK